MKTVLILSVKYLDGTSRLFAYPDTVDGGKKITDAKKYAELDKENVLEAEIISLELGKYDPEVFIPKELKEKVDKILSKIVNR